MKPKIGKNVYIADGVRISDDTTIGDDCGLFFNAVVRGDDGAITVGNRTNIQDNAVLHSGDGYTVHVGDGVTIGHSAIVHGCTVGNNCLIGMGAIILNGAEIGDNCIIGAGALVTGRTKIPAGSMAFGNPAKVIRPLTESEIEGIKKNADIYVELKDQHIREDAETVYHKSLD